MGCDASWEFDYASIDRSITLISIAFLGILSTSGAGAGPFLPERSFWRKMKVHTSVRTLTLDVRVKTKMKILTVRFLIAVFFVAIPWRCLAIDAWPAGAGTTIATYSDASGVVWHEARQSLFVVQNTGTLVELGSDGTLKDSWSVAGDLEGIALAENDRYLYIGIEHPDSIVEFDLQTEALTGKSWDLTTWMTGPDNSGLEGLAYRDGYFLAGLQADGKIYVFDVNLSVSGDVDYIETIVPNASYTDIAGIDYNSDTGIVYSIFDGQDALIELNASNEIAEHYSLPGTAQEGFAMKTNCMSRTADVYVANDDTGIVTKYTNYPITCLDADEDGVNYTTDCNDYDASISVNQTYWRDADGDGLGSDETTSVCSFTAPVGYVANTIDQNDSDFDNDGSPAGTDCNDADNSIFQNQTYYRDIDSDGLGDTNTTNLACTFSAPDGYISDNTDPADISENGRRMYVNGAYHDFFTVDPTTVAYTDLNFFEDDWHEILTVGLVSKKAYVTLARVRGSEVAIAKRVRIKIKKKHTSVTISTDISNQKFTTRFSRGKKYTWKVKSSGSFSRSK